MTKIINELKVVHICPLMFWCFDMIYVNAMFQGFDSWYLIRKNCQPLVKQLILNTYSNSTVMKWQPAAPAAETVYALFHSISVSTVSPISHTCLRRARRPKCSCRYCWSCSSWAAAEGAAAAEGGPATPRRRSGRGRLLRKRRYSENILTLLLVATTCYLKPSTLSSRLCHIIR